ncbi:hypothetical protein ACH4SP_04330 [Streptomyces sp. NPDC021093]|uniref:hypothetical protein n=1 Tax=Streptomyces sp. NPDC021093 TaxID=3365112 RepID=UPI00379E7A79
MTTFLQELSKRAAERWATLLLGPGFLFVICVVVGNHQGFGHALDLDRLRAYVRAVATDKALQETGGLAVAVGVVLVCSAAAGLAAAAAGRLCERAWTPTGPRWYVRLLTLWRARHWDRVDRALTKAVADAGRQVARERLRGPAPQRTFPAVERLRARRRALSPGRPDRPTRSGQRMEDAARRVERRYGLDLAEIWPHVWAVADGQVRDDIQLVRDHHAAAGRLVAWSAALLGLTAATGWWPAAVLATAFAGIALRRGRAAIDTLAVLVGTAVDLYVRDVADRMGVPSPEPFTATGAARLRAILRPEPF